MGKRFYDLLLVEKGKISVARYFRPSNELVFFYNDEDETFGVELVSNFGDRPDWENFDAMRVGPDGKVEVPWWVFETFGPISAFMVSPQYSVVKGSYVELSLLPIEGVEKPKKSKKEKKATSVTEFKKEKKTLSETMLTAAFGEEFDTKAGVECGPLQDYTDDL